MVHASLFPPCILAFTVGFFLLFGRDGGGVMIVVTSKEGQIVYEGRGLLLISIQYSYLRTRFWLFVTACLQFMFSILFSIVNLL